MFDKQIGQFVSIHVHEGNVVTRDSVTFMDHNHSPALEFTTLSVSRRETQQKGEPWTNFWRRKQRANDQLLNAVIDGNTDVIQKLLNPLLKVDDQPEVRYCNDDGLSAVHLAVVHDQLPIL